MMVSVIVMHAVPFYIFNRFLLICSVLALVSVLFCARAIVPELSSRSECSKKKNKKLLISGTIAPAREIPKEDTIQMILANLNLVVPIIAAVLVIIVAIIVLCVLRRGRFHKGKCIHFF